MLSMDMHMGKNRLQPNHDNLHCIKKVSIARITRTACQYIPSSSQAAGMYSDINLVKSNS